ncbi:N-acetylglucosamine-6-phosphate deacetylase [Levilactobacillus spicheri]|uniref:N-acetylglucosamine-6-phosphate deacetylase n=2 Tax=Levilactobacillus spicheri TaxID=216463 RepID=A0A0F3RSM7_9LACO|nr:N-acetylglucosamine-6-phosphate deacetylase [Levilactobacillus spicheri]KJW13018.1 N-acetylglucosamine-6-phosphate deacetylase [Levilactobacillus spicheri]KRL49500.1 N-acetylglucosamine-6-phosphate deacetylase [Levilactobacillus spicheri DSM 15429]GEO67989.1 N-acetylglucosamine-6-phosphate deacetylase [Levilactobacillus spicheri]
MSIVLKHAKIYTGDAVIPDGYIRFDQQIEAVGPVADYRPLPADDLHVVTGQTIVPGFIDVHSHGGYGYDSMDGDPDQIDKMVNQMVHEGITSLFPTTMTQSNEAIDHAMRGIAVAAERNPIIQGVHLEGPFIAAIFKGAQPEKYIKDPDTALLERWNQLSGHRVKLITYAPEDAGAAAFESYCLANGIVPSVGHSNATREQLLESRATHVTHLYNAQRGLRHREPGVTGHAMLEDNLYCEIICDGFHIVPDMIKLAYEQKGPHRLELVTDSMRAKGMPEGVSELGGQKVIVKDRQARLESGNLAGSVLRYDEAFRNVIAFTGCDVNAAVQMSAVNQAEEFGLTQKGKLQVGRDADLNLMTSDLHLTATYSLGRKFSTD